MAASSSGGGFRRRAPRAPQAREPYGGGPAPGPPPQAPAAAAALGVVLALLAEPLVRHPTHTPDAEAAAALERTVFPDPSPVPWDLPVRLTPEVERWIGTYTGPGRRDFQIWLQRMSRFDDLIRRGLRERGMPRDLIFVALVESGFHPLALSPERASGMWQFMEATAREHGLRVDAWVDERLDPVRSTDAALDFLEDLHERFGSWYLAAAAYNAGPERVARALRREGGEPPGEADFWRIAEHLPSETRQHVPRIVAAAVLGNAPEQFGFRPPSRDHLDFDRVFVPGSTTLERVAAAAGVPREEIRRLNPHLILGRTPPDVLYPVRIPRDRGARTLAGLDEPADGSGGRLLAGE